MQKILQSRFFKIFLITFLVIIAFTGLSYLTYGKTIVGGDDANITFVYARNFADGHGFVYNIGGERVEGFSSMLWTLIVAAVYKIFHNFNLILLLINILALTTAISYLLHTLLEIFTDKNTSRTKPIILGGILLAWITAIPNYIVWGTINLMEFGLYSAFLVAVLTIILRVINQKVTRNEVILFHVLLSALVLIRPESMLWGVVFIGTFFLANWYNNDLKNALRKSITPVLTFLITLGLLVGFRLAYFGYPLPNTYYAKVSVDFIYNLNQGYLYIANFANSNWTSFVLMGFSAALLITAFIKILLRLKKRERPSNFEFQIFIVTLILLVGILIPVINGGDQFAQFRFIQPIWPFFIIPFLYLISAIDVGKVNLKFEKIYLLVGVVAISFFVFYGANIIQWHKYEDQKFQTMGPQFTLTLDDMHNGLEFNDFFKSQEKLPSLAVVAAGGIKMTYLGDVNDLLGLNNVQMAHANPIKVGIKNHAAFEKSVFYEQKPELLNVALTSSFDISNDKNITSLEPYWNSVLKNLYTDEEFKNEYTRAVIYNKQSNKYLFGYFRKDLLEKLDKEIFEIKSLPSQSFS